MATLNSHNNTEPRNYYYLVKASTSCPDRQGEILKSWQEVDGPVNVYINHNTDAGPQGTIEWGQFDPSIGLVIVMKSTLELEPGTPVSVGGYCTKEDDGVYTDCKLTELSIVRGLSVPVNPEAMVYGVLKSEDPANPVDTGNTYNYNEGMNMEDKVDKVDKVKAETVIVTADPQPDVEIKVDVDVGDDAEDDKDTTAEAEEVTEVVSTEERNNDSTNSYDSHTNETIVETEITVTTSTMDPDGTVVTETATQTERETNYDNISAQTEENTMEDQNKVTNTKEVVVAKATVKAEPSVVRKAMEYKGAEVKKAVGPEVIAELNRSGLWAGINKRTISCSTASIADIPIGEAWSKLDGCELGDCAGMKVVNVPMAIYGCRITVCEDDLDDDQAIVTEIQDSLRFGGILALEEGVLNGPAVGDGLRGITTSAYTTEVTANVTMDATTILTNINTVLAGLDGSLRPFATVVLSPLAYADFKTALLANPGACCLTNGGTSFLENSVVVSEALEDYSILAVYLPAYKARIRRDMTFGNCQPCGELTRVLSGSLRLSGVLTGGTGVSALMTAVAEAGSLPGPGEPGDGGSGDDPVEP